ncbi:unnamed protein product [Brassicogethes aeneus]|uniref:Uncharacterized protein n=1 Tax=Brassicogethes aeneus TaxID=1431903 RepID=A0A9P0BGT5_BRAAE|nr:unnamed protein product [Brassicogethes aeneus]
MTSNYERVVAGGKGSRAIVILFSPNVQEYISLLLEIRNNRDIVPKSNGYLFAYPGVVNHWVRGDVVLKNFAKSSKIENPEAMTSNRLRKQIATLMQLINLDKSDYSQFSKFMGHTEKTHQEFYEITQDAYQTAKIAKLLNLFDQGKGTEYRNKELAEIDIDPNNVLVEYDEESENKENPLVSSTQILNSNINDDNSTVKRQKIKSNRTRWTAQQKKLVTLHFKGHIKNKKAPKKEECKTFINEHKDVLGNLDWVRVKTFVYNVYTQGK